MGVASAIHVHVKQKLGTVAVTSHLDLARALPRIVRRAGGQHDGIGQRHRLTIVEALADLASQTTAIDQRLLHQRRLETLVGIVGIKHRAGHRIIYVMADQVHLVHCQCHMPDAHQGQQIGMASSLGQQALARID